MPNPSAKQVLSGKLGIGTAWNESSGVGWWSFRRAKILQGLALVTSKGIESFGTQIATENFAQSHTHKASWFASPVVLLSGKNLGGHIDGYQKHVNIRKASAAKEWYSGRPINRKTVALLTPCTMLSYHWPPISAGATLLLLSDPSPGLHFVTPPFLHHIVTLLRPPSIPICLGAVRRDTNECIGTVSILTRSIQ